MKQVDEIARNIILQVKGLPAPFNGVPYTFTDSRNQGIIFVYSGEDWQEYEKALRETNERLAAERARKRAEEAGKGEPNQP
jgi:hypothetical protein